MGHPTPLRWRGHSYASLSWALSEMLSHYGPLLSDAALAASIGLPTHRVRDARVRAGIAEWRRRSETNAYGTLPDGETRGGPGRTSAGCYPTNHRRRA